MADAVLAQTRKNRFISKSTTTTKLQINKSNEKALRSLQYVRGESGQEEKSRADHKLRTKAVAFHKTICCAVNIGPILIHWIPIMVQVDRDL